MDETLRWIANQYLSTEKLPSTWCPDDWENIVERYDEIVRKAREITGVADKV